MSASKRQKSGMSEPLDADEELLEIVNEQTVWIEKAQAQIGRQTEEIDKLKAEKETLKSEIQKHIATEKTLQCRISQISTDLTSTITGRDEDRSAYEAQIQELSEKIEVLSSEKTEIEAKEKEYDALIASEKAKIEAEAERQIADEVQAVRRRYIALHVITIVLVLLVATAVAVKAGWVQMAWEAIKAATAAVIDALVALLVVVSIIIVIKIKLMLW